MTTKAADLVQGMLDMLILKTLAVERDMDEELRSYLTAWLLGAFGFQPSVWGWQL